MWFFRLPVGNRALFQFVVKKDTRRLHRGGAEVAENFAYGYHLQQTLCELRVSVVNIPSQ